MTTTAKLKILIEKAASGRFVSFSYRKDGEAVSSARIVRPGVHISRRMEKQGTPVTGAGNWHRGAERYGKNSAILKRGADWYFRGVDVSESKTHIFKIFKISGMSEIH